MNGYMGKLLFVNLTDGSVKTEILDEKTARDFLGGPMLGARILYEHMPAGTPVFAPESMIGFVCGLMNNSGGFMSCRSTVVSKSPVTGGWNDANTGGNFGPYLRKAGYDALFVSGKAEKPVYIFINDGEVSILDASEYWGKTTTTELEKALKAVHGNNVSVSSIGKAGENLSHMAAVMNDEHRAAARGGSGAVMGAKNLKAVVVGGTAALPVYDKAKTVEVSKSILEWHKNEAIAGVKYAFDNWGTGAMYDSSVYTGDAGIKNWNGSSEDLTEEQIKAITSASMDPKYKKKKFNCYGCPVGCGAIYEVHEDGLDIEKTGRPEYETMGVFGSMLLCGDPKALNYCNFMCNEYGFDTISFGGTLSWLMECYEKGIFTKEELGGADLAWGNSEAVMAITRMMCEMDGIGAVLANGSAWASEKLGKGAECLVTAGGIEFPMHDARLAPPLARTYKYDPTPGRHVKGGVGPLSGSQPPEYKHNPDAFAEDDVKGVSAGETRNACGFCEFTGWAYTPQTKLDYINAVTGWEMTEEELYKTGLRGFMMRHAFNLREGFRRKDATMSDRMLGNPPMEKGPLAGVSVDVEKMADNFYARMGCDEQGVPSLETLENLGGMDLAIKDLYPVGK